MGILTLRTSSHGKFLWPLSLKFKAVESEKKVLVLQTCPTLCDPMDCNPPGSSVHGILQARILEWVAIPFSRGSSRPGDRTWVSCIAGRFFTITPSGRPGRQGLVLSTVVFLYLEECLIYREAINAF